MKHLLLIAKREYLATVRTKGFIIGLILAPILFGGSGLGMALFRDRVDITDRNMVLLDHTGKIAQYVIAQADTYNQEEAFDEDGKQKRPQYLFATRDLEGVDLPQLRLELSESIRNGDLYAFIEIGKDVLLPESSEALEAKIGLYSKNPAIDSMRGWLNGRINDRIRDFHLEELGINPEEIGDIFRWQPVEGMELVEADESGKAKDAKKANEIASLIVPMAIIMLMFMLVMMGSMPLLNSVMEEKNQHIAETILSSASPFEFMFGKIAGGVAVSLTGSAVYIVVACVALMNLGIFGYLPVQVIPWFIIYLIMANMMLGSIMSAIGSACSDLREAQNLTTPAMLPIMIPLFVMMPVVQEPNSSFAVFMSMIPPLTPMLMLLRQSVGAGVETWQLVGGFLGLILFTMFCVWVASRIFRVAILLKGKTPNVPTLIKWAIKG